MAGHNADSPGVIDDDEASNVVARPLSEQTSDGAIAGACRPNTPADPTRIPDPSGPEGVRLTCVSAGQRGVRGESGCKPDSAAGLFRYCPPLPEIASELAF